MLNHALDLLLGDWRGARTLACLPGEYGPNLLVMARHGFDVRWLPVDGAGRLDVDAAAAALAADPPALVHLTRARQSPRHRAAAWRRSPRCAAPTGSR